MSADEFAQKNYRSTAENIALGFSGAKMLSMPPCVMKQLNNTN